MNVHRAIAMTGAEATLAEQFAAAPRSPERRVAFARFERLGLPGRRLESWHYTDLRAALVAAAPLAAPTDAEAIEAARGWLAAQPRRTACRLVLLEGRFNAELSDAAPAGVTIVPDAPETPPAADCDAMLALLAALAQGGCAIEVAAGVDAGKIEIVHIAAIGPARAVFTRTALRLGAGAKALVVERFVNAGEGVQRHVGSELTVGERAKLAHVVSVEDRPGLHIETQISTLAGGAEFSGFGLVAGGALVRRQIFATLQAPRAEIALSGLALLDGRRRADSTLEVVHAAPQGKSREYFRHVIADEATGTFQGKAIVRPHAQKTDGGMKSQAILLSPNAAMNNKPELEIFADDVICGHGATVGALDPEQIFYLQARGIPRAEAEAMLLEAFGADAIDRVEDAETAEALREVMRAWLAARG